MNQSRMSKVLIIFGGAILALTLALGIALTVAAAPNADQASAVNFQGKIVKGKVASIDKENQEFIIKDGEKEVAIKVDENTKYFQTCVPGRILSLAQHLRLRIQDRLSQPDDRDTPELAPRLKWLRPFGEEANFGDITAGDMVVVWLAEDSDLAERVQIIEPVTYAHVSGTITDITASVITIAPDDGEPVTLSYNESTIFTLKGSTQVQSGQSANAVYDNDNMLAKIVTVH